MVSVSVSGGVDDPQQLHFLSTVHVRVELISVGAGLTLYDGHVGFDLRDQRPVIQSQRNSLACKYSTQIDMHRFT